MSLFGHILNAFSLIAILASCYYINDPYIWFTDMILLGIIAVNTCLLLANKGSHLLYINSALVLLAVTCTVIVSEEPDEFCYLRIIKLLSINTVINCSTLHVIENLFGITLSMVIITEIVLLYQEFREKSLFKI